MFSRKIAQIVKLFSNIPLASRLNANIASNYFYILFMGVLSILLIPFYLTELGKEQWGIVAICISLQGFLMLLELGLSQYIPKQFTTAYSNKHIQLTLKQVIKIYIYIGLFLFTLAQVLLIDIFSFIDIPDSLRNDALLAARLFLFQFLFSFINNVNIAFFNGIEKQFEINFRLIIFASLKHLVAVLAILYLDKLAILYIGSFAIICFFEFLLNTITVFRKAKANELNTNTTHLQESSWEILKHSGGFGLGALLGMLTMQIDKLYLITTISIVDYGTYVLVLTLAMYLLHLQSPLQRAFLPMFIRADTYNTELYIMWRHLKFTFVFSICPCILIGYYSYDVLYFWLGDIEIAKTGKELLTFFAIAIIMNNIFSIFYNSLIKNNNYSIIISINIIILLLQFLLIASQPGVILLGAKLWLVAGFTQLLGAVFIFFKLRKNNLVI